MGWRNEVPEQEDLGIERVLVGNLLVEVPGLKLKTDVMGCAWFEGERGRAWRCEGGVLDSVCSTGDVGEEIACSCQWGVDV